MNEELPIGALYNWIIMGHISIMHREVQNVAGELMWQQKNIQVAYNKLETHYTFVYNRTGKQNGIR